MYFKRFLISLILILSIYLQNFPKRDIDNINEYKRIESELFNITQI